MTKPAKRSRADAPSILDFNTKPKRAHRHAAQAALQNPKALLRLFRALDRADENFGHDAHTNRKVGLAVLQAVGDFVASNPHNGNGRFSRPIELLADELSQRAVGQSNRMLPSNGSGSGGVLGRPRDHEIKAAAAYTSDFLYEHCHVSMADAAKWVAETLSERGFHFGGTRSKMDGKARAETVKKWRRDFPRNIKVKGVPQERSPAAVEYGKICEAPPVSRTGDTSVDGPAILSWFLGKLGRAGYGALA